MIINSDILGDVLDKRGIKCQMLQLQEECAELIVAVNHLSRGRISEEELIEEIADVFIMISQMAEIYGEDKIQFFIDKKMNRLGDRISKEHVEKK